MVFRTWGMDEKCDQRRLPEILRRDVSGEVRKKNEGNYTRRRSRNKIISADKGYFKTDHAGLWQTDDLLSAFHADAGGDPGDTDYFHAEGSAGISATVRYGRAARPAVFLWGAGSTQRTGGRFSDRGRVYRRGQGGACTGRQYFLRAEFFKAAHAGGVQRKGSHDLRILCKRSERIRCCGIWRKRQGAFHRGKTGEA